MIRRGVWDGLWDGGRGGLLDKLRQFVIGQLRIEWDGFFPKIKDFNFLRPAPWEKTESIFELAENINQEMKLFVDFFKKKIRSQFSGSHGEKESQFLSLKKTFNKCVSLLHFWKDVRSQISEAHEKILDSMFDLAKKLN